MDRRTDIRTSVVNLREVAIKASLAWKDVQVNLLALHQEANRSPTEPRSPSSLRWSSPA
ncbi:MAG: hypothetical protein ACKO8I_00590 [Cyanobacteriota bacterium]